MEEMLKACPDVVYCSKCKYYSYTDCDYGRIYERCKANVGYKYDYERCWKVYGEPEVINENGDCKDFKLKRWRKILRVGLHVCKFK